MSPIVAREPETIEALVTLFNKYLQHDGFSAKPAATISGRTIYKIVTSTGAEVSEIYKVVLSFAGEDREYVEKVAEILKDNDVSLFYDNYEEE